MTSKPTKQQTSSRTFVADDYIGYYSSLKGTLSLYYTLRINFRAEVINTVACTDIVTLRRNRVFALQKHRPLTLHATIQPPRVDDDPAEAAQIVAFTHLVNLYRPFDDTFVALWNKASVGVTITWLEQLQQQLSDALPVYLGVSDIQAVDLRVSQQWLRTMVWQLSMSYGFLSSKASVASMTLTYPIELSRDVLVISRQYSQETMEVHGIGFVSLLSASGLFRKRALSWREYND